MDMEKWRKAWRFGFAPFMPAEGLQALYEALDANSKELIQGRTVEPLYDGEGEGQIITSACAIGYIGWKGLGLNIREKCEEWFGERCYECSRVLKEMCGCRHFLQWYDNTPRLQAFAKLKDEVQLELLKRKRIEDLDDLESRVYKKGQEHAENY